MKICKLTIFLLAVITLTPVTAQTDTAATEKKTDKIKK